MKLKNKRNAPLTMNLNDGTALHLTARETSRELTDSEMASAEVQKAIARGFAVAVQ